MVFSLWLILRRPFNEPPAAVEEHEVIGDHGVTRIERISLLKLSPRRTQIAAQHVRISLIVQDLNGFAPQPNRLGIGLIGKIKAAQAVFRIPDAKAFRHNDEMASRESSGVPNGIRTHVLALKGPRPRPLDDGDAG